MSGWVYVVLVLVVLLGFGMVVDRRRRHSTGGLEGRSAGDYGAPGSLDTRAGSSGGGGCGGGNP